MSRLAERLCASRITHWDQEGLTLPRGATKVDGGMGRSEVNVLGGDVSFFGFLAILLLRCSPLAMVVSLGCFPVWDGVNGKAQKQAGQRRGQPGVYLTSVTNCARGRRTFFRFTSQSPSAR